MLFVQFSSLVELFRHKVSKIISLLFSASFPHRTHKIALYKVISEKNQTKFSDRRYFLRPHDIFSVRKTFFICLI